MIFNDSVVENAASALTQLLDQQLSTVGYDKTLVYTITNETNKDKGYYTVSDGSVTFNAYTEDTSFKKDDKVYVIIPRGDFSDKKVILGRYIDTEDEEKGLGYIAPKDRIVPVYTLDMIKEDTSYSLVANGFNQKNIFYAAPTKDSQFDPMDQVQNSNGFFIDKDLTRLVLTIGIHSKLSDFNVVSGEYGVELYLITTNKVVDKDFVMDDDWTADNVMKLQEQGYSVVPLKFSTKEMIGNIYTYPDIIYQNYIYDISNCGNIVGARAYFYQNNDFYSDSLTGRQSLTETYKTFYPDGYGGIDYGELVLNPNLSLTSCTLTFGYGQEEFEEDVNLLLAPSREQDIYYTSGQAISKSINLRTIQLNEDTEKYEYVANTGDIQFFQNSYKVEINKAGLGWEEILVTDNKVSISSNEPTKSFKALKVIPSKEDSVGERIIESNIIKYENTNFTQNVSGLVWLECDAGTLFNNYGNDYRLKNMGEARTVKTITAKIADTRTFKENIKIVWIIPTVGSMLQRPHENTLYTTYSTSNTKYINNDEEIGQYRIETTYSLEEWQNGVELKQGFGIRDMYVPTFANNSIVCQVFYDNDDSYCDEGMISFTFGQYESAGTDYQFALFYKDPERTCLYPGGDSSDTMLEVYPYLKNDSVDQSTLTDILQSNIHYSWKGNGTNTSKKTSQNECLTFVEQLMTVGEGAQSKKVKVCQISLAAGARFENLISDILVATVTISVNDGSSPNLDLKYELPISLGSFEKDADGAKTSKTIGLQAPIVLTYDSQGNPINNTNSMALKLLGRNIDNTKEPKSNDETSTTISLEKQTSPKVTYWWGTPLDKYTQVLDGAQALNASILEDSARVFKMQLDAVITIPSNNIVYIHRSCSSNHENNWYEIYIVEDCGNNIYLGYFIQCYNIDTLGERFGGSYFTDKSVLAGHHFGEYHPHIVCSSIDSNMSTKMATIEEFTFNNINSGYLITQHTSELSKISYNESEYSKFLKFNIPAGREQYGTSNDCKGTSLQIKQSYVGQIWLNEENEKVPIQSGSAMPKLLPTHTYSNLTFSGTSLILRYGVNGNLKLTSAEIQTIEKIGTTTNLKPYVVLFIGDTYINSASIDTIKQEIKFENIPESFSGKPAILYIQEIEYSEYEPNIGNVDYEKVLWRLIGYGTPENKNLGKYNIDIFSNDQQMGLPILRQVDEETYLQHYPFYCENNIIPVLEAYVITGKDANGNDIETILWQQPILIKQDFYGYQILNEWDGEKTVVGEKSIMSQCIGAGSKNDDNTFNGVLMGKIKKTSEEDSKSKHGLYGFNHGDEVFGFTEDGTAFIGKSSGGRILFDGNKSTIKSASYDEKYKTGTEELITGTGTGLLLDLDNPIFDLKKNTISLVKFNPDKNNPEMYLQTENYKETEKEKIGTKFDLISGYLKMHGKKTEKVNDIEKTYSVHISNDPDGTPIQVSGGAYEYEELSVDEEGKEVTNIIKTSKDFKVDWDGSLSATGADIKGDLTAGSVGGWNIATDQSTGKGWLGYTATFNSNNVASGLYEVYSKAFIDQLMKLKFQMRFNKQSVIDADWNGEFGLPGNFNIFNIKTYYKKGESPEIPDYEGDTWKNKTVESICESIFKDSSGNAITKFEMPSVIGDGEFGSKTYTKSSTYLALFKTMAEALDTAIEPYTDALTGIGKKKKDQITGRFYTAILQQISGQSKYYNPGDISNINKDKESNEAKDFDWKEHLSTSSNIVYWISPVYLTSLLLDSTFDDEESKKAWLTFTLGLIALQNGTTPISISSQGDIKTRGSLVVGGEASGTKIWALNANAKKWKIKYGDNSSEHDFFGVALPFSTSEWGQGIRFNGGYKSVLLNGSGIRFYNWGTVKDTEGNSISKWIHQGTWKPGKRQGIKLTYGTDTVELYSNEDVAHIGCNREKDNGAYITFGQSGMALKSYKETTSEGKAKPYITFHRGSGSDADPSYIAIRGTDDKVYYAFLANYKPGITKA